MHQHLLNWVAVCQTVSLLSHLRPFIAHRPASRAGSLIRGARLYSEQSDAGPKEVYGKKGGVENFIVLMQSCKCFAD